MSQRTCTVCNARGELGCPALYMAKTVDGFEWFECEDHGPRDNVLELERAERVLIAEWYARAGLSVPE